MKKKDRKEERGKLILPSSQPSAYATLHFLLLRVRLSKDTHGTDMHPKKKLKGAGIRMGWWWEWEKAKRRKGDEAGRLSFPGFFLQRLYFWGEGGRGPFASSAYDCRHVLKTPRHSSPSHPHTPPPSHTHK